MWNNIEIRRVENGFVCSVDDEEYVFDSQRKVIKFIQNFVNGKVVSKRTSTDSED
jgi:hypothetical protein